MKTSSVLSFQKIGARMPQLEMEFGVLTLEVDVSLCLGTHVRTHPPFLAFSRYSTVSKEE